jgi:hypothetical protein
MVAARAHDRLPAADCEFAIDRDLGVEAPESFRARLHRERLRQDLNAGARRRGNQLSIWANRTRAAGAAPTAATDTAAADAAAADAAAANAGATTDAGATTHAAAANAGATTDAGATTHAGRTTHASYRTAARVHALHSITCLAHACLEACWAVAARRRRARRTTVVATFATAARLRILGSASNEAQQGEHRQLDEQGSRNAQSSDHGFLLAPLEAVVASLIVFLTRNLHIFQPAAQQARDSFSYTSAVFHRRKTPFNAASRASV